MCRAKVVMEYWGVIWREGMVGSWKDLLWRVRDWCGVDEVRGWSGVCKGGLLYGNALCWQMHRNSCHWKSSVWWRGGRSVVSYGLYVRSIGWVGQRSWFRVEVGEGVKWVERVGWGGISWCIVGGLVRIVGRCLVGWREGGSCKSLDVVVWINRMLRIYNFWHMVQFRIERTYWSMNRKVQRWWVVWENWIYWFDVWMQGGHIGRGCRSGMIGWITWGWVIIRLRSG